MVKASSQKYIPRSRAPRVQIEYDVELYGAEKKIQLPFVMGVLADLSGKPAEELPPVTDRKFLEIDVDNFESRLKAMKPRVVFQVPNTLTGAGNIDLELTFENMDDFSPVALARKVDALNKLLGARQQLANLINYMDGKSGAESLVNKLLHDPALLETLATARKSEDAPAVPTGVQITDLDSLLKKELKPKSQEAEEAVGRAVRTLAEQALADTSLIGSDVVSSIEAIIAKLDHKLTEQINLILHHEDFQKLEGAWRGLYYLVNNTETDEMLKIRVLNISKNDLGKTLRKFKGTAWDQSPIFKMVESEYSQFGGEPFGCLVGDYYLDQSPHDVELLVEIAKTAAAAHCPFISGASPTVMGMGSWQELANPRDLIEVSTTVEYAAWRSLRESENSRYVGLAMPRFLARLPYGPKTDPVEAFNFEEDTTGADHSKYAWANSAYAMATNITRSFKLYGWCARIRGVESGGAVEGLPVHTFPTDEGIDMKCTTEVAISDRREAELAKNGFMPLLHRKSSDFAVFIGAQSLQKSFEYDDPDAAANANMAARLPYLFACCRFAQYLKCIARDTIGSFKESVDMQRRLNNWIRNYVVGDPANSSETTKAQRPLAAAEIVVEEVEGSPGYHSSKFFLRPHYQLEGLTVSLRLVSMLPSVKGG